LLNIQAFWITKYNKEHFYYVNVSFFLEYVIVSIFVSFFLFWFVSFLHSFLGFYLTMFANLGFFQFFSFFFQFQFHLWMLLLFHFALLNFDFDLTLLFFNTSVLLGQWWKKFKQTNVLQKLLKILLILCAPKRLWSKHLQPEIISQNK
jgi:hypothetical protein